MPRCLHGLVAGLAMPSRALGWVKPVIEARPERCRASRVKDDMKALNMMKAEKRKNLKGETMKCYLLNAAVMTTPGRYEYTVVDQAEARTWLQKNPGWISTIGYQEAVDGLKILLGITVHLNRVTISFESGDEALVFRLSHRVDPGRKGKMGLEHQLENHEFGILKFLGSNVAQNTAL